MGTPVKMQQYMERHRLNVLFEEMMNKVLHEQPDDPLLYMIKVLYRKSGMEIPTELKLGGRGLRKSSPERLMKRSKSPEHSKKTSTQHWGAASADPQLGREYEKPWQSHSRKIKPREQEEKSPTKQETSLKSSKHFHHDHIRPHTSQAISPRHKSGLYSPHKGVSPPASARVITPHSKSRTLDGKLDDVLQVTPITPGSRSPSQHGQKQSKQTWNADNKPAATSFDDLFEKKIGESKPQKKKEIVDPRKAWASIGLEDENVTYTSKNYRGPRRNRQEEEDPLAGEIGVARETESKENNNIKSSKHVKGRDVDAKKHKKKLKKLLKEKKGDRSDDSGYMDERDGKDDEAIELLEDGDELRKEGARHISKDGYKLSRIMKERQQEPSVKLNIKTYIVDKDGDYSRNLSDYEEDERPPTGFSGYNPSPGDSDVEEFESVSQVTGPRKPVWNVVDSDGESYMPRPSKTLPEPTRSSKYGKSEIERKLAATVPVRFDDSPPYPSHSIESVDSFLQSGKTWSPGMDLPQKQTSRESVQESVRSEKGGWQLPRYESDTSLAEWSTTDKSIGPRQPRAY